MELTDEAKAERLERQQQELERRRKVRNSRLFLFFGTVFEILETFLVIVLLIVFFSFLIVKVFKLPEEAANTIGTFSLIVSFFGGLFLGFIIYKTCANFVIEKFAGTRCGNRPTSCPDQLSVALREAYAA